MTDLKTDILVVGGGPGGFIITVTAATYWPEKKITVVRPEEKTLIPCGIPYIRTRSSRAVLAVFHNCDRLYFQILGC